MNNIIKSDKRYTHVFFHSGGKRGVYNAATEKIKYFDQNDSNFKNPAKLLAISGFNAALYVTVTGSDMTVTDMYYFDGGRFFTEQEITKYCVGFGWKYDSTN